MADSEDLCDAFLKLVTSGTSFVNGGCADEQFQNHIALTSFEFGATSEFPDEEARESGHRELERQATDTSGAPPKTGLVKQAKPNELTIRQQDGCQFEIEKFLDSSSPLLFEAYGRSLDPDPKKRITYETAFVYLRKATGGAGRSSGLYLTVQFDQVCIVEYGLDVSGSSGKETLKFSYGACRVTYQAQLSSGQLDTAVRPGWNFLSLPPRAI